MAKPIRLDKLLAEMQLGSRSQVKELIKKGRISIDGTVCKEPERKVNPELEMVFADGQPIDYAKLEYYMLNKPQGVISATEDRTHKTVIDLIGGAKRKDLFPVGRLDIDTEGLLLITNDGRLGHDLLSPKKHVDKVYFAKVMGTLPEDVADLFSKGMILPDQTPVKPARLIIERRYKADTDEGNGCFIYETQLTIQEGKFHQVKRMFEAVGGAVIYLKRLSMGSLALDGSLRPGEYRPLSQKELDLLMGKQENKNDNRN